MLNVMRCLMDTANVVPSRQKGGLGSESLIRRRAVPSRQKGGLGFESPNRLSAYPHADKNGLTWGGGSADVRTRCTSSLKDPPTSRHFRRIWVEHAQAEWFYLHSGGQGMRPIRKMCHLAFVLAVVARPMSVYGKDGRDARNLGTSPYFIGRRDVPPEYSRILV
jgi:hypothetical protein